MSLSALPTVSARKTETRVGAQIRGSSVNALIIDSLVAEIERIRADQGFTDTARRLLERDKELLERLAR